MATPAWVRAHRAAKHLRHEIAEAEMHAQATARHVTVDETPTHDWTPRRGMTFAGESGT